MPSTNALKVVIGLSIVLLAASSTVLKADSPYESTVHSDPDRSPPERPAELNSTSAEDYVRSYEEQRLLVSLLATRGYKQDVNDELNAVCTATSVSENAIDEFEIELRCQGGIDDSKRLFEPEESSYHVTYRVTENETDQLDIRDYPFSERRPLYTVTPQS